MKAITQNRYGDASTLQIAEVPKPSPKDDEVLVAIKATSLNAPDWRLLSGKPFIVRMSAGLTKPKHLIKGTDVAGVIEAVGKNVKGFKVGDAVFGDLADSGFGAFAEFVCVKETLVAHKPKSLSHVEAAALPLTAVTALQGLYNLGAIQKNEDVLIVGASGGVGSYALQLAKYFGAKVTALTGPRHQEQAKKLGADFVIDYTQEPLENHPKQYDLIVAINGYNTLATYRKCLKPRGRFVLIGSKSMGQILQVTAFSSFLSKKGGQTFKGLMAKPNATDLAFIAQLVDDKYLVPVIEREVSFEQIPQALADLEKGHTGGKIVAWIHKPTS